MADLGATFRFKPVGDIYVRLLAEELTKLGKVASGKLIRSLDSLIIERADGIDIKIIGEKYLEFVDSGRRPGKMPPVQKIAEWCTIKGLPQSAAWGISVNIYKFGIKPTHVLELTRNRFEIEVRDEVVETYQQIIQEEIDFLMADAQKRNAKYSRFRK